MAELKIQCPKFMKAFVDKYNVIKEPKWIKIACWIGAGLMLLITILIALG